MFLDGCVGGWMDGWMGVKSCFKDCLQKYKNMQIIILKNFQKFLKDKGPNINYAKHSLDFLIVLLKHVSKQTLTQFLIFFQLICFSSRGKGKRNLTINWSFPFRLILKPFSNSYFITKLAYEYSNIWIAIYNQLLAPTHELNQFFKLSK